MKSPSEDVALTTKANIAVMNAFLSGHEVESRRRDGEFGWKRDRDPSWNFGTMLYRVRPQGNYIFTECFFDVHTREVVPSKVYFYVIPGATHDARILLPGCGGEDTCAKAKEIDQPWHGEEPLTIAQICERTGTSLYRRT